MNTTNRCEFFCVLNFYLEIEKHPLKKIKAKLYIIWKGINMR